MVTIGQVSSYNQTYNPPTAVDSTDRYCTSFWPLWGFDGPLFIQYSFVMIRSFKMRWFLGLAVVLAPFSQAADPVEFISVFPSEDQVPALQVPAIQGANWGNGRRLFLSPETGCVKCHSIPDSSARRDDATNLRDIPKTIAVFHPEFSGDSIPLKDEQVLDLMAYLMKPPPSMPLSGPIAAPSLRTASQVAEVLAGSTPLPETLRRMRVVLVAGPKDHGPSEHDYPAWLMQWGQLLTAAESLDVEVAWEFPVDQQLATADVLVFFQKGSWDPVRARAMDRYFGRGGGAIYLHWAVNGSDRVEDFSKRIGLASWGGKIKYRHGPLELKITDTAHPIMRNVPTLDLLDESYWLLTGDTKRIGLLATSQEDGLATPQLWTYEPGQGRVFVSIPGHYSWTFDDPIFRTVILRAMAWTAREPIDRFNELVPLGARVTR